MKKVILTKGLPGAGKDYWAEDLMKREPGKYKRINKDMIRTMLDNWYWTPKMEDFTLKVRDYLILEALKDGYNILCTDTNLNPVHEQHIRKITQGLAEVVIEDFTHVSLEVCIDRDKKRLKPVGYKIIRDFYFKYLAKPATGPIKDPKLPNAVISDLDGTLSLFTGKRSPYDASTCDQDDVNEPVADILRYYKEKGVKILFVSGRKDKYATPTLKFLYEKVGFSPLNFHLYMRPSFLKDGKTEDNRKDWIIKQEIYDRDIKGKWNILCVFEDRKQVKDMCWVKNGLFVFDVNQKDEYF